MSELALTLLRLGFLALLWVAIFVVLNFMRRDLKSAERPRGFVTREAAVTAGFPGFKSKINRIVVVDDSGEEMTYPIQQNLSIGRSLDSNIVIADEYASTNHAFVDYQDNAWTYTDNNSTNGSWQERKRITAPVKLKPGMKIRIGRYTLRFEK